MFASTYTNMREECKLSLNIKFENWFLCSSGSYLSSLECLDLSNNNLSTVPKGLPRSLVLLHLEKNAIQNIPGDALTSVRNLEYLLLHNNKLRSRSIHPAAFQVHRIFVIYFSLLSIVWFKHNNTFLWKIFSLKTLEQWKENTYNTTGAFESLTESYIFTRA